MLPKNPGYYTGEGQCVCCGLGLGADPGPCGHLFCYICKSRGHDEDCVACEAERDR